MKEASHRRSHITIYTKHPKKGKIRNKVDEPLPPAKEVGQEEQGVTATGYKFLWGLMKMF